LLINSATSPHLKLGGVAVAELVDTDLDPAVAQYFRHRLWAAFVGQRAVAPVDGRAEQRPGGPCPSPTRRRCA
jgi:hypothetical protein